MYISYQGRRKVKKKMGGGASSLYVFFFTFCSLFYIAKYGGMYWACATSAQQFRRPCRLVLCFITVKLGFKELLNKEQIGFKELFTDYRLFYIINLLLNKELLPI